MDNNCESASLSTLFFVTVLQITKYRVQSVMKEYYQAEKLLSESDHVSLKYTAKREKVMSFINKIPCEELTFSKKHKKVYYLSSELSIYRLYKVYNSDAADDLKVKKSYFRGIYNTKYNLSFGTSRTDVHLFTIF